MKRLKQYISFLKTGLTGNIITLLFLSGIVPLGILTLIFSVISFEGERQGIRDMHRELAKRVAVSISADLERTIGQVRLLARFLGRSGSDFREFEYLIADFIKHAPEFETITLADTEGLEILRLSRHFVPAASEPRNSVGDPHFASALKGKISVGEVDISPYSNLPRVRIVAPVTGLEDEAKGVVAVQVNIYRVSELVSRFRVGNNRYGYVVDGKGFLIASGNLPSKLEKVDLSHMSGVGAFLARDFEAAPYRGISGEMVIGSHAVVLPTGWGVIVEEPVRFAFHGIRILFAVFFGLFVVTGAATLFLGYRFSFARIVQPVRILQRQAVAIARGELGLRIDLPRADELGELAESFNRMAGELQQTTVSRDRLIREVREREEAERDLRAEKDRTRKYLDIAGVILVVIGADQRVKRINKAGCGILGFPEAEILGKNWFDHFIPVSDREKIRSFFMTMVEGKTPNELLYEGPVNGARGNERIIAWNRTLLRDETGRILGTLSSGSDITERKLAESALLAEKEKFRVMVEESPFGVFIIERNGTPGYLSPRFVEIFGYPPEDFASGTAWLERSVSGPEERAELLSFLKGGSCAAFPRALRIRCKKGDEKIVHITPVAIGSGDRFIICEDVTEKGKLEERIRQVQRMESIGTLAGGIAHNFNNLLMGIQGNVSLMLLSIEANHPHRKMLEEIERQIRSGAGLTRQLLAYARKGKYEVRPIQLNRVVMDIGGTFEKVRRDINVHYALCDRLPPVEADRDQLEQMLLNLFINAGDAMPRGGDLFLETACGGSEIFLLVRDTGIGMDPEVRERIFEPFFTTKEMGRGTGLGLSSVYGVVKGHGGFIEVESEKGRGTTFRIRFPASVESEAEEKRMSRYIARRKGTVLVVDDEEAVLSISVMMLEHLGFNVFRAATGASALETYTAEKDRIDLVILDMILPDMDGGEIYRRMIRINPSQKVLLASGYSLNGQAEEILREGCDGFIQKPFTLSEVSVKIAEIMDEEKLDSLKL